MSGFNFKAGKAFRTQTKLRMLVSGISGAGKSCSVFRIATGLRDFLAEVNQLEGNGRILVIEAGEPKSAEKFCPVGPHDTRGPADNIFDFDVCPLKPPFTPEVFIAVWQWAEEQGYPIVVTDQISSEWGGSGGVLSIHNEVTKNTKNKGGQADSFRAWGEVTPKQNMFVDALIKLNAHHFVIARAKEKLAKKGNEIVSIGTQPIQRKDIKFEFDGYGMMRNEGRDHYLEIRKFRNLPQLEHQTIPNPSMEVGKVLGEWLTQATITTQAETTGLDRPMINRLQALFREAGFTPERIINGLGKYFVTRIEDLSAENALLIERNLKSIVTQAKRQSTIDAKKAAEIEPEPEPVQEVVQVEPIAEVAEVEPVAEVVQVEEIIDSSEPLDPVEQLNASVEQVIESIPGDAPGHMTI